MPVRKVRVRCRLCGEENEAEVPPGPARGALGKCRRCGYVFTAQDAARPA